MTNTAAPEQGSSVPVAGQLIEKGGSPGLPTTRPSTRPSNSAVPGLALTVAPSKGSPWFSTASVIASEAEPAMAMGAERGGAIGSVVRNWKVWVTADRFFTENVALTTGAPAAGLLLVILRGPPACPPWWAGRRSLPRAQSRGSSPCGGTRFLRLLEVWRVQSTPSKLSCGCGGRCRPQRYRNILP